jgi:signal transduction histidine kinase
MEEGASHEMSSRQPGDSALMRELDASRRELARRARALERSEARFRDVIERNCDAIVVVDREGHIRFANEAATSFFGVAPDALVGAPFGLPLVADETTEVDLRTNGTARVAEMRVVASEWQGRDAYLASLRDITERKRMEQTARQLVREQEARTAAEKSARRFRFLAESSAVLASSLDFVATLTTLAHLCVSEIADWAVIYCVDDDGDLRRIEIAHRDPSKAQSLELIRELPVDRRAAGPILEVLRTQAPVLATDVSPQMLGEMTRNTQQFSLAAELGIASYMLVPIVARERALGAISLVSADPANRFDAQDLALAEDLAARAALAIDNARLYEAAQRANQAKTDFLAVISHDLRTPLNAVLGYAELLEMGVPEPLSADTLQRVERIRTSANHLLYLINELLAYARLDGGGETAKLQEVDLRHVLREVRVIMEPRAAERGLALDVEIPEEPLVVTTDPDKLRQVLINLAGNAVRYTETGEVRVRIRYTNIDRLEIEVCDTGIGIAPGDQARVFEPFWQADQMQRSRGEGTGLGLSIVRRLARLLGGDVTLRSEPGKGSVFCVILPLKTAED